MSGTGRRGRWGWLSLGWLSLGWGLVACGQGQPSAREQAQSLLTQLQRIEPGAEPERHQAAVQALGALPLLDPGLIEVREVCLAAQRGLLKARDLQHSAQEALQVAAHNEALRLEQNTKARAALRASDATLVDAQQALKQCRVRAAEVARRYR